MHVADFMTNRARLTPEREALLELETGRRFSYRDLNERANRCAHWLRSQGVVRGDRVSILAHNSVVYLDLFFACAKLGAIFAPLNWRLAEPELAYILSHCTPRLFVVGAAFAPSAEILLAQTNIETAVSEAEYEEAVAHCNSAEPPVPPALQGDDTHCILYTSGTTGRPKGAMIPHRQVLWNCINTAVSWGLTENDVTPVFTPMFHTGGLFAFLMPIFYLGGRAIITKQFDAEASLRVILEERCTVILGVPTLFQMWRQSALYDSAEFDHVHFFISGGAPCPPALIRAWREEKGVVFRQGYGLTEVGPNCFSMTDDESAEKVGCVGKPIFHSQMRLLDANGNEVGEGETGELCIKGPHVTSGYWQDPKNTAKALVDGWFHTGDMARRDADGFFTIVGRFKDMIISGGENIYAAEVEAVAREHEAVVEAALIGKPHEKWGEIGLMIVQLEDGAAISAEELQQFCRQRLAKYKVPKEVIFVDEMPISDYGKVEKVKLKAQFLEQPSA